MQSDALSCHVPSGTSAAAGWSCPGSAVCGNAGAQADGMASLLGWRAQPEPVDVTQKIMQGQLRMVVNF